MQTIEDLIQETQAAFNADDAERFAATFADDAWTVGVTGQLLEGRAAILEASRALFAGPLAGQHARYVVDDVRHLDDDLAVVRKLAYVTDEAGRDLEADPAMVALYVLVRDDEGWRVAARQNTLIPPPA
jgi:uncharacterized protein (TIGR02246 family)